MNQFDLKKLGESDIQISGLRIWIHGYEFPDAENSWDNNWLRATVLCGAKGAMVWATGSIIQTSELQYWLDSSKKLYEKLDGEARLDCIEPELFVIIKAETLGHLSMTVNITPDHLEQSHEFHFEIDQSYLPRLISSCSSILVKYPVK